MAKHDDSTTEPTIGPDTPSGVGSANDPVTVDREPTVADHSSTTATPATSDDEQRSDPAGYPADGRTPAEDGRRDARESKPKARRGTRAYVEDQQAQLTVMRERNGWTWAELGDFLERGGTALNVDQNSIDWVREQALSDPSRPTGDPWGNQPDVTRVPVSGDVKDNYRAVRRQSNATWQEMADDALAAGAHQSLIDWMLDEDAEDSSRPQDRVGDEPERGPLAVDIQSPPPLGQQVPSRVPNISPDAAVSI